MTAFDFPLAKFIAEMPLTQLPWDRFMYKVVVSAVHPRPRLVVNYTHHYSSVVVPSRAPPRPALRKFLPKDPSRWRINSCESGHHYYFITPEDAQPFITRANRMVREVWRPQSAEDYHALLTIKGAEIKKRLYLGQYRYCIRFRYLRSEERAVLDSWVPEIFGVDEDRYAYSQTEQRRLYFNNEDDVLLTRIGFGTLFARVSTAVIRSDSLASTACPETDR